MKKLIIYGGDITLSEEIIDGNYIYQIGSGSISGNNVISLNNSKKYLDHSRNYRDKYVEYIFSLNKLFLKENLIYDKSLSLFFLTDLSNKRTEIYNTYQTICHIQIIRECLKNIDDVGQIILHSVPQIFFSTIKLTFNDNYDIKSINIINENISFIKLHIRQLQYFINSILCIIILKILKIPSIVPHTLKSIYFTRYPKHFTNTGRDSKYGRFFKDDDHYLISIIADGFHQNIKFIKFYQCLKELKWAPFRYILLDNFLSIGDCIKSLLFSFKLYSSSKIIRNNSFIFDKIDISSYIRMELFVSFQRIPRLTMYHNGFVKFVKNHNINNFILYLFEFAYGRYFTYLLREYSPHTKITGFQHGPNSQRHIMFFLAQNEAQIRADSYLDSLPIPDEIMAENIYAKKVYEDGNYKNIILMDDIYRLDYLKRVDRKNIIHKTVLVAAAMHDGKQLFSYLKDEMIKNKEIDYYFKFHPKAKDDINNIKKLNKKNIIAANKDLTHYLSFVSKVIVTQSSVGYEANLLGIPVRVVSLPNKINDSPLLDIVALTNDQSITVDFM